MTLESTINTHAFTRPEPATRHRRAPNQPPKNRHDQQNPLRGNTDAKSPERVTLRARLARLLTGKSLLDRASSNRLDDITVQDTVTRSQATPSQARPAGHRISSPASFDAQWCSRSTPHARTEAANKLTQRIHATIFGDQGLATINMSKDVRAHINDIRRAHGRVRLVVGGQRGPDDLDPGSHAFIWDPYYNPGRQRAQAEDFSINTDLAANPDMWGDPADAKTMDRLDPHCFDNILIEDVPIEAVSKLGDQTAQDIAQAHHSLQAAVAQGSTECSVIKAAITYSVSRQGLLAWQHLARTLAPGGEIQAQCYGHRLIDRNTTAAIISAAQEQGLVVAEVTLTKSAITPAYSCTTVTLGTDLKHATVTVTRDSLLGQKTHHANGPWLWQNNSKLPHFERLLSLTNSGAAEPDIFDNLSLRLRKPGPVSLGKQRKSH